MAEQIASHALTALTRVKDRLSLTTVAHDVVLSRLISAVSDFIESECGSRRFKETTYANEVYSIHGVNQEYLFLRHAPVASVTSLQYRAGLKSNPNWTDFTADDWELLEDGKSGIIKVYGGVLRGTNAARASYTAGYKIDFPNAGAASHTLPFDLTDLAERLVTKLFKRREAEGKASEAFEGGTVTWGELLNDDDQRTLARYRRIAITV